MFPILAITTVVLVAVSIFVGIFSSTWGWPIFYLAATLSITLFLWAVVEKITQTALNRGGARSGASVDVNQNPRMTSGVWASIKTCFGKCWDWMSVQWNKLSHTASPYVQSANLAASTHAKANPWLWGGAFLALVTVTLLVLILLTKDADYLEMLALLTVATVACFITHYKKWAKTGAFFLRHWVWATFVVSSVLFGLSFLRHWDMEWKFLWGAVAILSLLHGCELLKPWASWLWKALLFQKGVIPGWISLTGVALGLTTVFCLLRRTTPLEILQELLQDVLEKIPNQALSLALGLVVVLGAVMLLKKAFAPTGMALWKRSP